MGTRLPCPRNSVVGIGVALRTRHAVSLHCEHCPYIANDHPLVGTRHAVSAKFIGMGCRCFIGHGMPCPYIASIVCTLQMTIHLWGHGRCDVESDGSLALCTGHTICKLLLYYQQSPVDSTTKTYRYRGPAGVLGSGKFIPSF